MTTTKTSLLEKKTDFLNHSITFIYFIIFGGLFLNAALGKLPFFNYITNISVMTIFFFVTISSFSFSRKFALTYLALPAFGFAWTVFTIRLSFNIFGGYAWLEKLNMFSIQQNIFVAGDFGAHFFTLFCVYHLLYIYRTELKKVFNKKSLFFIFFISYAPYFIIVFWSQFHDAFGTYFMPRTPITLLALYLGIPIILTIANVLFALSLRGGKLSLGKDIYIYSIGLLANIIIIGLAFKVLPSTYAASSIIVFLSALIVLLLIIGIQKKPIRYRLLPVILMPLFGFSCGFFLMREAYNIILGISQKPLINTLIQNEFYQSHGMIYHTYIAMHYIFTTTIVAGVTFALLPYDLSEKSTLRETLKFRAEQSSWRGLLEKTWQLYGGFIFLIIFLAFNNFKVTYFSLMTTKDIIILLTTFSLFQIIVLRSIYKHQIKNNEKILTL